MAASDSSDDLFDFIRDPAGIYTDSDGDARIQELLDQDDDEAWPLSLDAVDLEYVERLKAGTKAQRQLLAYVYGGDILVCRGTHANPAMHWRRLSAAESRRWCMDFLGCLQKLIEELHAVFEPLCPQPDDSVEGTWSYTGKQVLLVTLHFLAHCPNALSLPPMWLPT